MLGDQITVTVDAGGRAPEERKIRANSNGGKVSWERDSGMVLVTESTGRGRVLATHAFAESRVVSVVEEPRGR